MDIQTDRISAHSVTPAATQAMLGIEAYLKECGLEPSLIELVKMRASQINGCAFCLDLHARDARRQGESEQRLYLLSAWRESSLFTARERAALSWTEALTLISSSHAPDDVYEETCEQFTAHELADLTLAICQINSWNRFAVGFRYQHP